MRCELVAQTSLFYYHERDRQIAGALHVEKDLFTLNPERMTERFQSTPANAATV
jgi:hypothetical protein